MLGQVVPLAAPVTGRLSKEPSRAESAPATSGEGNARSGLATSRGFCRPLGATVRADGVNFAVFTRHATWVHLLLFEEGQEQPFAEVPLDGKKNPRQRASTEAFEAVVKAGDKEFAVLGRPLEGVDGGYGALIFRSAPKK